MKHKRVGGSQPEEQYTLATRKKMFLDRPTSHGGWPEGEYDPPVQDRIYGWYKSMGMMPESEEMGEADEYVSERGNHMRITESMLRRIIREEYSRLNEANDEAVKLCKSFSAKDFKTEAEMQSAKKKLASDLSAAGAKGKDAIRDALDGAGYGDDAASFAFELAGMQSMKESQRGNDQNSQHDNDTDPGDPYAKKLKESRLLAIRKATMAALNRRR